ncbi:hypothetical protein [Burkholderia gladioli]|nr:hypothetical protein [Burkholderia gladioli]MBU9195079.1 hypothetical protein [Burkholderia gladioli]MBU9218745.1 hypothetical protein [Burkholderia gladioli]MBU9384749.1 hypothetical protein [Burkholderia gladioli]MBU9422331.1 hypothetical protein [Burkholderia gladioli]MDN7727250.1 hypothetical protein [Burkholderia gladioli]
MITCSIKATPLFDWPLPLAPAAPPDLPGFAVLAAGDMPEDMEAFEDFASLDALVEAVVAAVEAGFGDVAAAALPAASLPMAPAELTGCAALPADAAFAAFAALAAAAASARRCLSRSPLPVPEDEVSKALV